ncbi:hypothetical protein HJG60_011055 [Phyllostomus discolor]|uniref:Uncharacterized protein n=1 Tax=Phyllostomus discolor TaxID=89673 RepID=A0A834EAG9_9CHIR|nr:hypothetical protein HJG60_011055 [Phyllostomus discolor]
MQTGQQSRAGQPSVCGRLRICTKQAKQDDTQPTEPHGQDLVSGVEGSLQLLWSGVTLERASDSWCHSTSRPRTQWPETAAVSFALGWTWARLAGLLRVSLAVSGEVLSDGGLAEAGAAQIVSALVRRAAVAKCHTLGGLERQTRICSQFWSPDI